MGAQTSVVKIDEDYITETIASTMVKIAKSCAASTVQSQKLKITNTGTGVIDIAGLDFEQDSSINLTCIQELSTDLDSRADFKEDIIDKISSKVADQTIGSQYNATEKLTKAVSRTVNSIDYQSITECMAGGVQTQDFEITNTSSGDIYLTNISAKQSKKIIQKCIQTDKTVMKNISDLTKTVKKELESSTTGFLNSTTLIVIAVVAAVAFIIFIIAAVKLSPKAKAAEAITQSGMSQTGEKLVKTLSNLVDAVRLKD